MNPVYTVVPVGTEGRKMVSRLHKGTRSYLHILGEKEPMKMSGTVADHTVLALEVHHDRALILGCEGFVPEGTVYQGGMGVRRMAGASAPATSAAYRPSHGGYPSSTYTTASRS